MSSNPQGDGDVMDVEVVGKKDVIIIKEEQTVKSEDENVKTEEPSEPKKEDESSNVIMLDAAKEEEEEDEVVKEIDVILSDRLSKNLFLLQYPLRPPWRAYPPGSLSAVKWKPNQESLSLSFSRGDGNKSNKKKELEDDDDWPEEDVLTSTTLPSKTHYALALLRKNELHLTPTRPNILQLRPSFAHIDEKDKRRREEQEKAEEEEEVVDEEEVKKKEEAKKKAEAAASSKALSVRFGARETERAQMAKKNSYAYMKQQEDEEKWIPLKPHTSQQHETQAMFDRLISQSRIDLGFDLSKVDYLNAFHVVEEKKEQVKDEFKEDKEEKSPWKNKNKKDPERPEIRAWIAKVKELKGVPLVDLKTLPLEQQIISVFAKASILKFDRIKQLVTIPQPAGERPRDPDTDIIKIILDSRHAYLVRGVFLASADIAVEPKYKHAWEHMLFLFHSKGFIERKPFASDVYITPEEAKELLKKVATPKEGLGWVLNVHDRSFIEKYGWVENRFTRHWDEHRNKAQSAGQSAQGQSAGSSRNAASDGKQETTVRKSSLTPAQIAQAAQTDMSTIDGQLTGFLIGLFQEYGVCNMSFIKQQLEFLRKPNSTLRSKFNLICDGVEHTTLLSTLNAVASIKLNVYYLKSTGDPQLDKYRDVVINYYNENRVSAKRTEIIQATRAALGEEIPANLFPKIMKEFCYSLGNAWIFRDGNGRADENHNQKAG